MGPRSRGLAFAPDPGAKPLRTLVGEPTPKNNDRDQEKQVSQTPGYLSYTHDIRLLIKTIRLAGMATYHRTFARVRAHLKTATMSIDGRFLAARLPQFANS